MEPTATDLQAQIDRLSLSVQQGRDSRGHLEPMAQRLAQLAERCTEILNSWSETDRRHAAAVGQVETRLSEWTAIENRLQHDTVQRLRELEAEIHNEWKALREIHEEPVKQLREQAAALGEVCMSAANVALQGFERTEARLAALETNLEERLNRLSLDFQHSLAQVRQGVGSPDAPPPAPFPLESVMRIHEEMREAGTPAESQSLVHQSTAQEPLHDDRGQALRAAPEAAALSARVEVLEREVTNEREEVHEAAARTRVLRRDWRFALGLLGAAIVAVVILGIRLQQSVDARLAAADSRVAAAEQQAEAASTDARTQIASTRAAAERQIAEARVSTTKAEIVTSVLAAPDLVRYNLVGTGDTGGAYAQALWSRTHGLVLSVSGLAAAPAGSTYQLWFLSNSTPVSGGTFTPDASGRVTLAADNPANLPRPVTGFIVTLEPSGGQTAPSGVTVLARAAQQQ